MGVTLLVLGFLVLLIGIGVFAGTKTDFTIGVDEGVGASARNVIKHMIGEKDALQKGLSPRKFTREFSEHLALVLAASADQRMVKRFPSG